MKDIDDLADTVYATLKKLVGDSPDEALDEKTKNVMAFYESLNMLHKHLTKIIKERTFTITGDTGHLSVQFILDMAKNIDQPKKYDFQKDDVNESDFLRNVLRIAPERFGGFHMKADKLAACIAGEESITFDSNYDSKCYDCAKKMRMTLKGNHIHIDCETACENNREFSVEVEFPTGEVVYADWPARFSEIRDEGFLDECDDGESINYLKGQRQRSEGFAAQGIYHQSVGNTCPTWYYNETTHEISIGGGSYDEETDESTGPEGFKEMGYFCTDLWWVTMLDRSLYDDMVSKLPKQESKKYYQKNLTTAKIKPGRYRFTAIGRTSDDDECNQQFTRAEYLGPCKDIPKKAKNITEDKIQMTPRQYVLSQATRWPTLYKGQDEEIRFSALDHLFNCIGNGIRSKGEFLAHISVPVDTVFPNEFPPTAREKEKWETNYVRTPYPNFQKQYSTFWQMPLDVLSLEWLEELEWFYKKCEAFFASDNVGHYSGAFPGKGSNSYSVESQSKIFEGRRKEGQTEEEWKAAISKDWSCEFDGDVEAFCLRNWAQKKAKIDTFLEETLKEIGNQIALRKKA